MIVVATLIGVRLRPQAHLRYAVVGDLDSLGQVSKKSASMLLASRTDFDLSPSSFLWMLVHASKVVTCDENWEISCALLVVTVVSATSVDAMGSLIFFLSRPSF